MKKDQLNLSPEVLDDILLDSYLERIHYNGERKATLKVLRAIHYAHTQAIPFENINPLSALPVRLDLPSIQDKLISSKRGGYCFEHNLLLAEVLRRLGFSVKCLAARVMWNVPPGVITARGHMLLSVLAEGIEYIADVGFGGLTLPTPLLLKTNQEQETSHETFRLIPDAEELILQVQLKNEWKPVYRFSLQEQFLPDYEVTNYYLSTNPASHFTHTLIAARISGGTRYALRNNELATHSGGQTERYTINDALELKKILQEVFLIKVPEEVNAAEALSNIINRSVTAA